MKQFPNITVSITLQRTIFNRGLKIVDDIVRSNQNIYGNMLNPHDHRVLLAQSIQLRVDSYQDNLLSGTTTGYMVSFPVRKWWWAADQGSEMTVEWRGPTFRRSENCGGVCQNVGRRAGRRILSQIIGDCIGPGKGDAVDRWRSQSGELEDIRKIRCFPRLEVSLHISMTHLESRGRNFLDWSQHHQHEGLRSFSGSRGCFLWHLKTLAYRKTSSQLSSWASDYSNSWQYSPGIMIGGQWNIDGRFPNMMSIFNSRSGPRNTVQSILSWSEPILSSSYPRIMS